MTDEEAKFTFFMPIAKVDKAKRTVSGYASTECLDMDGETVAKTAIEAALPGYWQWRNIREMHQPSAVGVAQEANIDDKGLYLTAKISDNDAWQKCLDGVYKGFSIGGRKLAKTGNKITKIDLVEVSIVDRPSNPECTLTVQKAAAESAEAYLIKPRKTSPGRVAAAHMAKAVAALATSEEEDETLDEEVEKREVPSDEREDLAGQGNANSDGSFPIKNKSDLKNAIQAFGRSKDKPATKKLIIRRAKELDATDSLPDKWKAKLAKRAEKKAAKAATIAAKSASVSAPPAFLTLSVDGGAEAAQSGLESVVRHDGFRLGHDSLVSEEAGRGSGDDLPSLVKREKRLMKRMGIAGSLSYCFDSIREAQRGLMFEAKREGGDKKDVGLASDLGQIAQRLAGVIGQKAEHEGAEALDFSDADDQNLASYLGEDFAMTVNSGTAVVDGLTKFLTETEEGRALAASLLAKRTSPRAQHFADAKANMKKVKEARKEAGAALKSAHSILKAAYLAKQAALEKAGKKKPDDGDDDMDIGKAMQAIQKAYSALEVQKTFAKAAEGLFTKAAGRFSGEGAVENGVAGVYEVPDGVRTLSPGEMDSTTKGARVVSKTEIEALERAARAEGEADILKRMPAGGGGRGPVMFDTSKIGFTAGETTESQSFFKGANAKALSSDNTNTVEQELGRLIGEKILKGEGKSIFSADFKGFGAGGAMA